MTCYSKPTFPLLKLPYLAFDIIIKQLKIGEIMLMLVCSKRLAYLIRIGKNVINDVHIHLKPGDLQIEVNRNRQDYCDLCFNSTENREEVPKGFDSLSKWFRDGTSAILNLTATDSFEDIITVASRLRTDFRVQQFCYKLFLKELKDRNLKELISSLDFSTCFRITLVEGEIDTETLSFLIDRMDSKMRLEVTSEIPLDFKHPRALDFRGVKYEDARWMTVENLKTIRNGSYVHLTGRTNFNNDDINEIIKYWTECKEMMFTKLSIKLKDEVEIDENHFVNGVISCRANKQNRQYYLSKKLIQTHSIGSVEVLDGIVTLTSWIFDSLINCMVPILKLLELKSVLTIKYSELNEEKRELRARLETVKGDGVKEKQEIRRIEDEQKCVENKFYETVEKLNIRQVDNIDLYLPHIA